VHGLRRTYHRLRSCFGRTGWNSNLISVRLETVLALVQDRCTGSANVPQTKKLFRTHPMELLDDEAQVEARFGPFGDSAHLDGRYVHGLRQTYHWLRNHFTRTR
jgi:hypothetical protein